MGGNSNNPFIADAQSDLVSSLQAGGWIGVDYAWGGNSMFVGLDCSEFTRQAFGSIYGIDLPDGSSAQLAFVEEVGADVIPVNHNPALLDSALEHAQIGDMVFFNMYTTDHNPDNPASRHLAVIVDFEDGVPIIAHASAIAGETIIEPLPAEMRGRITHVSNGFLESQEAAIRAGQDQAEQMGFRVSPEALAAGDGYINSYDYQVRDFITNILGENRMLGLTMSEGGTLGYAPGSWPDRLGVGAIAGQDGSIDLSSPEAVIAFFAEQPGSAIQSFFPQTFVETGIVPGTEYLFQEAEISLDLDFEDEIAAIRDLFAGADFTGPNGRTTPENETEITSPSRSGGGIIM